MERRVLLPLVILLAAIAALVVWTFANTRHAQTYPVAHEPSVGQATALANDYRQLDARLARLEALLGAGPSVGAQPSDGVETPSARSLDPAAMADQQSARTAELQARFRGLFESDPRANDAPRWEAVVSRAFSDPNVAAAPEQPSSRSVQCRTRLCQVTARFPPDSDGSDWATRMSMALAEGFTNNRLAWTTLPSGETALTLYAFKKGRDRILFEQGI